MCRSVSLPKGAARYQRRLLALHRRRAAEPVRIGEPVPELAIQLHRRRFADLRNHRPSLADEHQIPARRQRRLVPLQVGGLPLLRDKRKGKE
jgi:hypothetical protein